MKVEEILDYKLKRLLGANHVKVTTDDKKFILAQAKNKIQAYCHRRDMPKAIYYIWVDIAIEVLKGLDISLFKKTLTEEELAAKVTSVSVGDSSVSLQATDDLIDTGYDTNGEDAAILNSFARQLQQFRKFAAGTGDGLDGV